MAQGSANKEASNIKPSEQSQSNHYIGDHRRYRNKNTED